MTFGNETTIPTLPCTDPEATIEFYSALGFELTYRMNRPYLYLAFKWQQIELHFGAAPSGLDIGEEMSGGCLIMVDKVRPYHEHFTAAMRERYGRVLAKGRPRMTRYKDGQTRFSLIDPNGNTIIVIERTEPELDHGAAKHLDSIERALENARIFREFKTDYPAAAKVLDAALGKFSTDANNRDRARLLAARAELAILMDDAEIAQNAATEIAALDLNALEQEGLETELAAAEQVRLWLEKRS
ncbi:hypothetical protein [Nitratireductor thuwali]|uniref:Glyoxalase n=1 Tax=Nitratireductor thuwali TaxID=2267699 RepID=A0ABY5MKZ1_9HYPH|nr:hypothetical protein NTH_02287 [Nitratireductor thuwali]